jgi:putative ABC transport system permease protein
MIGLTLVTAVAVLSASFKETFSSAVRDQTTADFILSPKGFQPFSPAAAQLVREQVPGSTVVEYRPGSIQIAGESTEVIGASPDFTKMTDVHLRPGARRAAFAEGGLYVYKNVAKDKGYQVGDRLDVTFPDGPSTLTVQGIFDNNRALPFGGEYVVSLADWGHFPNPADIYAGVLLAPGTSTQRAERTINRIVTTVGGVQADNKAGYIDRQLAQFNQILGLMYVLLMLAVIIALVGIVNTLALSVYERTREIGLLRAVGMSRAQLRRMIRGEALVVAIFGSILGLVIGLVFAYLIVAALQSQGITFAVPVAQLVIFMLLAALAGLVAGAPPARRAARLDILQAINTD